MTQRERAIAEVYRVLALRDLLPIERSLIEQIVDITLTVVHEEEQSDA